MKNLLQTITIAVVYIAVGIFCYWVLFANKAPEPVVLDTQDYVTQDDFRIVVDHVVQMEQMIASIQSTPVEDNVILGSDNSLFIGGAVYYLSGSGISSSATTIGLTSLTLPQNGYKIQDSDLSSTFYITIEPGSRTKQEFVSCTTLTQNGDGTATLTGCTRGLAPISPYTASSTLQFAHSGGKSVVFSNPPQLYNDAAFKNNDESITGIWSFTSGSEPRYLTSPSLTGNSLYLASVGYVDALANQGAATATESVAGISEQATQLEMASSTAFDADNPHFMSSEYATSAPSGTSASGLYAAITQNNGKLHQSFWDLTQHFIFSSLFATNASTTNATTTNLTFTGITSSLLKTDSNGKVAAATKGTDYSAQKYFVFDTGTASASNNSYATTTTTITIPSGTLNASSSIRVKTAAATCVDSSSGATCNFSLRLSTGQTIWQGQAAPDAGETVVVAFDAVTYMNGGTSAQASFVSCMGVNPGTPSTNGCNASDTTSSLDLSGEITLLMVIQNIGADSGSQLQGFSIEVDP